MWLESRQSRLTCAFLQGVRCAPPPPTPPKGCLPLCPCWQHAHERRQSFAARTASIGESTKDCNFVSIIPITRCIRGEWRRPRWTARNAVSARLDCYFSSSFHDVTAQGGHQPRSTLLEFPVNACRISRTPSQRATKGSVHWCARNTRARWNNRSTDSDASHNAR